MAEDEAAFTSRRLTEATEMRALAHPTRLALLELLGVHGPLTATEAGRLIGESPASCSFHLRTLARFGFVAETGDGKGRQRPWEVVDRGTSLDTASMEGDTRSAGDALSAMYLQRALGRMEAWMARRHGDDPRWDRAAGWNEFVAWITPTELEAIDKQVQELFGRYAARLADPSLRPEGARSVELLWIGYPAEFGEGPAR